MTHVTCRLTATNRDQLRNPTLSNRVWATFIFFIQCLYSAHSNYCILMRLVSGLWLPDRQSGYGNTVVEMYRRRRSGRGRGHTRGRPSRTDTASCYTAPCTDSPGTGSDLRTTTHHYHPNSLSQLSSLEETLSEQTDCWLRRLACPVSTKWLKHSTILS